MWYLYRAVYTFPFSVLLLISMSISTDRISVKAPSTGKLVYSLIGIAAVAILFSSQLQYSKKEYVSGFFQGTGGDLRVVAPSRGTVNFTAKPGSVIAANEPIATIQTTETLASGKSLFDAQRSTLLDKKQSLNAELEAANATLQNRAAALASQRAIALQAVEQAKTEVNTRKQFLQLEESKVKRQIELQKQGFVSAVSIEQSQAELLARKAELQSAERGVMQAQAQVASLDADISSNQAQLNSQRQQLQRELVNIEQATNEAQKMDSIKVVAPKSAAILNFAVTQGDTVEAGQLLAKLSPKDNSIEAMLLLPPTSAGRVKVGQTVALQLSAYPYQTYGLVTAEITEIENAPVLADETTLRSSGVPNGSLVVKATARIKNVPSSIDKTAFQSGMQFRAAIEVERKSFLSWMTWPLLKHFL